MRTILRLDLDFSRDLDRTRALALDLADDLDRALADLRDRADLRDPDHALADLRDRAVAVALDLAPTRTRPLADVRDSAVTLERDLLTVALADLRGLDHARARAIDRALDRARDLARDLAHDLERAGLGRAGQVQRKTVRTAPLAGRLLVAAARMLPAGDRGRYAEEFRSELAELARSGAGRRPQLAYAARQVMSARRLRADLQAPQRRRAAP